MRDFEFPADSEIHSMKASGTAPWQARSALALKPNLASGVVPRLVSAALHRIIATFRCYSGYVEIGFMYTDPGSGLFFAQVVIASALTMLYRFRRAVASLFGRKKPRDSEWGK